MPLYGLTTSRLLMSPLLGGPGRPPLDLTAITSVAAGSNGNQNFNLATGLDLGTAAENRLVFVTLGWSLFTGTREFTGLTLNGHSLTQVAVATSQPSQGNAEIWAGYVTTGTTNLTLACTCDSATSTPRFTLTVFRAYGTLQSFTPISLGQSADETGTLSHDIDVPAGGVAFAAYSRRDDAARSLSGITETANGTSATGNRGVVGGEGFLTQQTDLSVSIEGGTLAPRFVVASLR